MEIVVKGSATDYVTPNQVILDFNFKTLRKTYELALKDGVNNVANFMDQIISENGFLMENMKTRSFSVRKEWHYDPESHKKIFDGFAYEQFAQLKFDYDKEKLALMLEALSHLGPDAPICNVDFGVKDSKSCQRAVLAKAYQDAQVQAEAIAEAAGKNLQQCAKVDFKPLTSDYTSGTNFGTPRMMKMAAADGEVAGAAEQIIQTFTPEDIRVSETLYCLWIAE